MELTLMKAKLHRATVTEANIDYEGSVSIDSDLLKASGILPYEQIEVYNITNGSRFSTYAIEAPAGSRTICINGAAARLTQRGDLVILCAYARMSPEEAEKHKPTVILLDTDNTIKQGGPVHDRAAA